jgi:hypothetical protein
VEVLSFAFNSGLMVVSTAVIAAMKRAAITHID